MTPSELSKIICERMKNLDFQVLGRFQDSKDALLVIWEKGEIFNTFILRNFYTDNPVKMSNELYEEVEKNLFEAIARLMEEKKK